MTIAIVDARGPKYVVIAAGAALAGALAAQAAASASLSQAAAVIAENARDVALTEGPYYTSVALGESATTTGQEFAVATGDGTAAWYRRTAGGSTLLYRSPVLQDYTFAGIASAIIPTAFSRIIVTDRGNMIMKRVGSDPGALFNSSYTKTQDVTGAWWQFDTEAQKPCAQHFAVVMEPWGTHGGTDQTAKLQAFINFFTNVPCWKGADVNCETAMTQLDFKPATGVEWATKHLSGVMRLRGIAFVTGRYSIEGNNPNYFHWDGGIVHSAFGSSAFEARGNWGGIAWEQGSRGYIGILHSSYNIAHAVKITKATGQNSNLLKIGRVGGNFNGCGFDFASTTVEQTIPNAFVAYGGDTTTDQRTRIGGFTLAQLPHPAFDLYVQGLGALTAYGSEQRTDGCFAWIENYGIRKICHIDRSAGALGLYPAVPSAANGLKIRYICGSACALEGADANVIAIDMIEGSINGTGYDGNAFYSGTINQFHCDGVGLAITGGQRTSAGTYGGTIANAYIEAASYGDLVPVSLGWDLKISNMICGQTYPNIPNVLDPVSHAAAVPTRGYAGIANCEVTVAGHTFKNDGNITGVSNAVTIKVGGDYPPVIRTTGPSTITLSPVAAEFKDGVDQYGARRFRIVVGGTGAGDVPGGAITLAAISGYKFNGGAVNTALVIAAPTKRTVVEGYLNIEATDWLISTQPYA